MSQTSSNVNSLYHQYTLPDTGEILSDKTYYHYDQSNQTGYHDIWQNITENLVNLSLRTTPPEFSHSSEIYTMEDASNETYFFPLATMLEESWWNVFDEQYFRHDWEWTVTLISAYMLILVAGVIGNSMVILVVLLRPQMRTVTNMFIMNLAVADLFVIIFCVGPTLLANIFLPWILGSFMCKGVAYIQGVSVCASAYSLVAISLDRCYAVYRPLDRYRGISKSQALKVISLIWIIALSLTLPWAVIFNIVISDKDGLAYCQETWEDEYHGNLYFLIINLMFCYGLPLVIISVSNAVVWCNVTNRNVPQESASAAVIVKRVHQRARENVRKMLSIVTLTFLLSWLPLYILVTRLKFAKDMSEAEQNWIDMMMPFAQWLGSWNSCVNPIIYAFLNRKFREEFHLLLPSWIRFFQVNKMMGMGMGGYGVNVSSRNYSTHYRHSRCRYSSEIYRNSSRIRRGHRNSSTVRLSSFRQQTDTFSSMRLHSSNVNIKNNSFAGVNASQFFVKAKGTSGTITEL